MAEKGGGEMSELDLDAIESRVHTRDWCWITQYESHCISIIDKLVAELRSASKRIAQLERYHEALKYIWNSATYKSNLALGEIAREALNGDGNEA
jgi:hypothetical protein